VLAVRAVTAATAIKQCSLLTAAAAAILDPTATTALLTPLHATVPQLLLCTVTTAALRRPSYSNGLPGLTKPGNRSGVVGKIFQIFF
jgi:hypothetical protein